MVGPGKPGSWDARGHLIFSVLFDGSIYHMWFRGLDQNFDPTGIGHATSSDGLPPWEMDPNNPVLTRGDPGEWDDQTLWSAAVVHDGSQFHLWYNAEGHSGGGTGYATSPNGSEWTKYFDNPVIENGAPGSWDEFVVPWTVMIDGGTYRMWFYGCCGGGNRIGYAESADGIVWAQNPDPVLSPSPDPTAWDGQNVACMSVVFDGTNYHGLYLAGPDNSGPSFGYAFSDDGIHWTKHPDNPFLQSGAENIWNPIGTFDGSAFNMWYSHWDHSINWISHATSDCCAGLFGDDFETGDISLWSLAVP